MPKGKSGKVSCNTDGCSTKVCGMGMCSKHMQRWLRINDPEWAQRQRDNQSVLTIKNRDLCYAAYGGYRCVCCGETTPLFLTLDHIHGNGRRHLRELGLKDTRKMYRWIIRNDFPSDLFQVLCYNCNSGRYRNGGVCPHKEMATA